MGRILCIIDGMTDPKFCAAEYPNLASMDLFRYVDTTQGHETESLGCILRLLGATDVPRYLRGYAEALGCGLPIGKNDMVLRGSWYALDEQGCCTVPIPGPKDPICADAYRYYALEDYKSLVVFPQMAGSIHNLITYPPYECVGKPAIQLCPQGCEEVRDTFMEHLQERSCLLLWGQSVPSDLPPFSEKAAVVCGTTIVKGIAKLLGMTLLDVAGATGDTDTNLSGKAVAALASAEKYPFVLLHINGTDEASHRGSADEKDAFLKKVDRDVLSPLLRSEHEVIVVSDHGTDPDSGRHIPAKQPVFINRVKNFN